MELDDFIKYGKEQFGCEISIKNGNPDTFDKIFGLEFTEAETDQIRYALEYLHDADLSDYGNENLKVLENVMRKLDMKFQSQLD